MVLKYALHWIVIAFRELGNIVRVNMSSNFCTIAIYDDTPYFCSFRIYLYDTYSVAGSIMDIRCVL